ncbi:MAG: ABC transporter ATP-binding protein [Methanosphaera sp.]|nr:ABC transporter ATP-binding protein [Methanosphaera sp.]
MTFEIKNVSKQFDEDNNGIQALKDINLTIESGKFVCFIGPSGCGKTTLLRLMEGFENPTEGTIKDDGQLVLEPSSDRGFIFQQYSLYPWLNVLENVTFGLEIAGENDDESKERSLKYLESVGLKDFAYNYPHELSGGMKQRVAIIRTIIRDSKSMLMDEPFSALDIQSKQKLQELLVENWKKYSRTIIFVTHDVNEAVYLADEIVVFTKGPGQIKKIFNNEDLPRPRDRLSKEFVDRVAEVTKYIDKSDVIV